MALDHGSSRGAVPAFQCERLIVRLGTAETSSGRNAQRRGGGPDGENASHRLACRVRLSKSLSADRRCGLPVSAPPGSVRSKRGHSVRCETPRRMLS